MEAAAYVTSKLDEHDAGNDKVVSFEQEGVFIHFYLEKTDDDRMLGGTLRIIEEGGVNQLEWKPYAAPSCEATPEDETEVLSGSCSAVVGGDQLQENAPSQEITTEMRLPSPDMKSSSYPDWTVVAEDDAAKKASADESFDVEMDMVESQPSEDPMKYDFTMPLDEIRLIKRSKKNVGWKYLILELADGACLPPLHFHKGGCKNFLKALDMYVITSSSTKHPRSIDVTPHNHDALTQSFGELNIFGEETTPAFPTKFLQQPVTSAFSGFSKVTNFLQDMLNPAESVPQSRPENERATLMHDDTTEAVGSSRIQIKPEESGNSGFEVITCAELGPRSDPPREPPITVDFWNNHKDEEGRMLGVEDIKESIFRGGVEPDLRKEVWKYLLNYFPWNMTRDELKEHKRKKEEDYYTMKLQWKSVNKQQESRFSALRDHKSLIDKDVTRTDRTRLYYEGKDNVSLKLLNDILVTYVMYNFDLGYVQGMSDLLSPILETMGSEVDAFWCFVGYMDIVQLNFEKNQNGMKKQLHDLRTLIQFIDPKFFDNLTDKDSNNLYFCFRWLLLRFKREFSFEDIQTLWEVMWTDLPCPNYHLVICVALLDSEKQTLMDKECGFTEILKHINELSGRIDLEATLRKAEGIYRQLSTCKRDLSDTVRAVLGLTSD